MSLAPTGPSRRGVAAVIARREVETMLRGLGIYVALSAALIAAAWLLLIDVRALVSSGLLVSADPFRAPLQVVLLIMVSFLATSAAVSITRERESGTLETLLCAPVDEVTYLAGKAMGLLMAYVAMLPLLLLALGFLSLITGFVLSWSVLVGLVLSVVPAAEIFCFGILLAIGAGRVRTAVLLLVGVIAFLLGVTLASQIVASIPITEPTSSMLPLRDALMAINVVVREVSPFATFDRVVDGAISGAWQSAARGLVMAVALTVLIIAAAAVWMRRRGVEWRGE
jgi:ABC-type transport system involved in multi-copper enzyme maturation permease subunit